MRRTTPSPAASALVLLALVGCPGGSSDGGRDTTEPTSTMTSTAGDDDGGPDGDTSDNSTSGAPTTTGPGEDTETSGDTETTGVPLTCGDGEVQEPEACDDANDVDADGCNRDCTISGSILFEHTQAGGADLTEEAFGVAVDDDGNAYVAGELSQADADVWIRQYTTDDGLGFTAILNPSAADGGRAVAARGTTAYVAGYAGTLAYVVEIDTDGNTGWSDAYNGPGGGSDVAHAAAVDPSGNVLVAGQHSVDYFDGLSNIPQNDGFVRKYDPAGAAQWTMSYAGPQNTGDDRALAVAADSMGNVYGTGFTSVSSQHDIWVRKYDPAGGTVWTQTFAGADGLADEAHAIAVAPDDTVVVAGFESSVGIPTTVWLRKYDADGNEVWTETWPGATAESAAALGVAIDDAGDIVITGWATDAGLDEMFVRKYGSGGTLKWSTPITGFTGTTSVGRAITIAPNQRIWVVGGVDLGIDGRDIYVARLAQ